MVRLSPSPQLYSRDDGIRHSAISDLIAQLPVASTPQYPDVPLPHNIIQLLKQVASKDPSVQVRKIALSAPQLPISSVLSALNDVDGQIRSQAVGIILTQTPPPHIENIYAALALLSIEEDTTILKSHLAHVANFARQRRFSAEAVMHAFGQRENDNQPMKAGPVRDAHGSLRDTWHHHTIEVRSTSAGVLAAIIVSCLLADETRVARVAFGHLQRMMVDAASNVACAAVRCFLDETNECQEQHKIRTAILKSLQLTSRAVSDLLLLHGGRGNTSVREQARDVLQMFRIVPISSFEGFTLVATFLRRRLYFARIAVSEENSDRAQRWYDCLEETMTTMVQEHDHFAVVYDLMLPEEDRICRIWGRHEDDIVTDDVLNPVQY